MKSLITAVLSGLIFSLGLTVGGMTLPSNVIGFLDIAGTWRPALAFVMGGAILVFAPSFHFIQRRQRPIFEDGFHLPLKQSIDFNLILGAALFGVGWGIGGFCPGPAITALGAGAPDALIFVSAMAVGMWIKNRIFPA